MMLGDDPTDLIVCQMETPRDDAISIDRRADEVAEWLHSVIDIPDSPFGTLPHGESTRKIHFGIPDAYAKIISKEDYHKYYEPRVVSIGPFHHGKSHVAPMEKFKQQAVRELAERVKSEVSIEQVYASVEQDLLTIAKECYDVSRWQGISDPEWCLMMFLDGCFVIEFISNTSGGRSWLRIMKKHDKDSVHRDLLLLENQLPFEVLRVLAEAFKCEGFDFDVFQTKIIQMPLSMIYSARLASIATDRDAAQSINCRLWRRDAPAPVHLLQYCIDTWAVVLFEDDVEEEEGEEEEKEEEDLAVCPPFSVTELMKKVGVRPPFSVTELKKVGIRCSYAKDLHAPRGIQFESSILSGNLFLPRLTIDEGTVTSFSNILAYEDSYNMLGKSSAISSYLNFMCMLINGKEDVKELRARGILKVNFNIADDINLFRGITTHTESNHKVIRNVKQQISDYGKSKRLPLRIGYAEFKQKYFSGPRNFFVFIAVIFTVCMTLIQTYQYLIQLVFGTRVSS